MNRMNALATVRAEFAKHGRPTIISTRAYVEHNISYMAYMVEVYTGMKIYNEAQKHDEL